MKPLKKSLLLITIAVFLTTFAMLVRTLSINTNDLFLFGHGGHWTCNLMINFTHIDGNLEFFQSPDAPFTNRRSGPFFIHRVADGGTWAVSNYISSTKYVSRNLWLTGWITYSQRGIPIARSFWINLPFVPAILLTLSTLILTRQLYLLRHRRRLTFQNRCPTCSYDHRASTTRCPECGTKIS